MDIHKQRLHFLKNVTRLIFFLKYSSTIALNSYNKEKANPK